MKRAELLLGLAALALKSPTGGALKSTLRDALAKDPIDSAVLWPAREAYACADD